MKDIQRRSFIKGGTAAAAGVLASAAASSAVGAEAPRSRVVVVHGDDIAKMIAAGIAKMGGWGRYFKEGQKVAIKPNLAWKSTPEQGGNTQPDIIRAVVQAAEKAKVKQVVIPENTCHSERETFPACGVLDAIKGTGAKLYRPRGGDYVSVEIPSGKTCKKARVTRDLIEADCLVNIPVAKNHSGAVLTLSMKNWMGAVDNRTRQGWHRQGLHQCIADFSTYLKPTLIIIDATRIMLTRGPQGPGKLAHPHEIIFSTDPVAADAYAATLFKMKPADVPHIRLAAEMGIGCIDLDKVELVRVEA